MLFSYTQKFNFVKKTTLLKIGISALLINLSYPQIVNKKIIDNSGEWSYYLKYYHPESLINDPINFYSLIHLIEYSLLSIIPFIKNIHFWSISITWEILELFIKFDWARESWLNKLCDLIFNWFGFYLTRKLLKMRKKF